MRKVKAKEHLNRDDAADLSGVDGRNISGLDAGRESTSEKSGANVGSNPTHPTSQSLSDQPAGELFSKKEITNQFSDPKINPPPAADTHTEPKLVITNVQPYDAGVHPEDVAWFKDATGKKISKTPYYMGFHDGVPCVLVCSVYGTLIPPYLISGFLGMYPTNQEFPEVIQEQEPEPPQEEEPQPEAYKEPIIAPPEAKQEAQGIDAQDVHAFESQKESVFKRIFARKTKKEEVQASSSELAAAIIDAAKPT